MSAVAFDVVGTPAPQGSKRAFVVKGRAVMAESSKKVKPWRQDVKAAAIDAITGIVAGHLEPGWTSLSGPVELRIVFRMPRPGYHFRTGARAHELKPNAPTYVAKRPDLSKLIRSTEDALTESGIYRDDAQVARLVVEQVYADGPTGAHIAVTPLEDA